ncbi:MAG: O-antigen ligase family protein [bacterium]
MEQLRYKNLKEYLKLALKIKADNAEKIVPRGTIALLNKSYAHIINNYFIYFPLFAVLFSFLSIMWTTNWQIGLFRSVKLFEFVLLYFYVINIVPRGTIEEREIKGGSSKSKLFHVEQFHKLITKAKTEEFCSTWNKIFANNIVPHGTMLKKILFIVALIGIFQSFIGITQFLLQKSIGLFWLKESIISQSLPGIAKIIINDHAYIRAYGLFPHPNILAGHLILSIISYVLLLRLFHVEQFKPYNKSQKNCSTWNSDNENLIKFVPRGTIITKLFLIIQIIALLLTFSKSAFFGLLVALLYIKYKLHAIFVPRGTKNIKLFHVEQYKKTILLIAISILLIFNIHAIKLIALTDSLTERLIYLKISYESLLANPIIGVGAGQFVPSMAKYTNLLTWQYQPVHNVFALIINEYGIFIFIGFIFYLIKAFKNEECSTWNRKTDAIGKSLALIHLRGALLSFLFIMFFDHYFWDIQQGQILLWLLLGLIISHQKNNQDN